MQRTHAWHALAADEVLRLLKTNRQGLTPRLAAARLKTEGKNELPGDPVVGHGRLLLSQLTSPLVVVLLAAAIISAVLSDISDALFIVIIVALNTTIGYVQERKANNALTKLKQSIYYQARIIRDGREQLINTTEIVVGDVVVLEAGNRVPADCRIISAHGVAAVEAALTGESEPSIKTIRRLAEDTVVADQENMLFMGTAVASGRAIAVVCTTGINTELGKIANLVARTVEEQTPLQEQLSSLARWLAGGIVVLTAILFVVGVARGQAVADMFLVSVAVAVAAIPEGLAVALTVILVIGMQNIFRLGSLVRRLVSAETLGGISVICTDKTGTLTEGVMRVAEIITAGGKIELAQLTLPLSVEVNTALQISALCNDSSLLEDTADMAGPVIGDSTDHALLHAAAASGIAIDNLRREFPRFDEMPFNSEAKYMATAHRGFIDGARILVKGAPEIILARCQFIHQGEKKITLTAARRAEFEALITEQSATGARLLALAYRPHQLASRVSLVGDHLQELIFVGLVVLHDPLRADSASTITQCRAAGIRPIMITGDHRLTALAIARQLGLATTDNAVMEGRELDALDEATLAQRIKTVSVYARVEPRHKLQIVQELRRQGEVVAMTGDGINDAPALKAADIGVALGSGTDVARQTADLVLLDDSFRTIVAAVRGGRVIFDNIRKVLLYLLSGSLSEIVLVGGAIIAGLPLPVLAAQILWINLVEDGLPTLALAADPEERGIMNRPPRPRNAPLIDRPMRFALAIIIVVSNIITLGLLAYLWRAQLPLAYLQTFMFAALGVNSAIYIFACRSLYQPLWRYNPFANWWLTGAIAISVIFLIGAIYVPVLQSLLRTVPLRWDAWVVLVGIGILNLILIELVKALIFRRPMKMQTL